MESLTFFINNRQRLKAKDNGWINESSIPFMWIHHQSLNQSTNTYLWIAIIMERERAIHHRELDKNKKLQHKYLQYIIIERESYSSSWIG